MDLVVGRPSGSVTFFFTDIEGSTQLWEAAPDPMRAALVVHDSIVREAIESEGGYIFSTGGDGFAAAFERAHDALAAAEKAQLALASERWPEGAPIRVRMALHTGEAAERDDNYFGGAVNRTARLMAIGHGGQLLVSAATAELLTSEELIDLGEYRLRDLAVPVRVFQVGPERFPALRTLDATPGNLPPQLSSFIGRNDERHSIAKAIEGSRLVTLTGPGGIGKTRLALEVASDLIGSWRDGIWFCDLVPATERESSVHAIASALGIQPSQDGSLAEHIVRTIAPKTMLVILDNCEHVLDAIAPFVEDLLRTCPRVRLLATSREPIGADGEHVAFLPPLEVPAPGAAPDDAVLCDAVRLFGDRAAAARSDFAVEPANVEAIVDICRRLDGIPLAIELAAARVVAMSPQEIDLSLDDRMRLLSSSKRTIAKRHRTLSSAIDWSYSLLDHTSRSVFDRLGVFVGTFDRAGAQSVCSGSGASEFEVFEALLSLVGKSLVTASETPLGTTRYSLLETIRDYATDHLVQAGTEMHWRRRHAEYYVGVAERVGAELSGVDELAWRPALRADLPNIAASVTWSLDSGEGDDGQLACRAIAALARESIENRLAGIGAWAERCSAAAERSATQLRFGVLTAAAWSAFARGDARAMASYAAQALRDGLPPGCSVPAWPYVALATSALMSGDIDRVAEVVAVGRHEVVAATDDASNLSAFHSTAGVLMFDALGQRQETHADVLLGLELARRSQNPTTLARALWAVAFVTLQDDPTMAAASLEESIALIEAGTSDILLGFALGLRAELRAAVDDTDGALHALREAVSHAVEVGDRPAVITGLARILPFLTRLDGDFALPIVGAVVDGPFASMAMVPLAHKPAFAASLTSLSSQVDTGRFESLRSRGAAMSYEELISFVLVGIDRLTSDRVSNR